MASPTLQTQTMRFSTAQFLTSRTLGNDPAEAEQRALLAAESRALRSLLKAFLCEVDNRHDPEDAYYDADWSVDILLNRARSSAELDDPVAVGFHCYLIWRVQHPAPVAADLTAFKLALHDRLSASLAKNGSSGWDSPELDPLWFHGELLYQLRTRDPIDSCNVAAQWWNRL